MEFTCTTALAFTVTASLVIGFSFGRDSGFKKGLKEGAKRQLHKEAYDNAPFDNKHDEPILQEARDELAKELKPKSLNAKMSEGKNEVWVSIEWTLAITLVATIAWLFS